jgi:hypothetical protein
VFKSASPTGTLISGGFFLNFFITGRILILKFCGRGQWDLRVLNAQPHLHAVIHIIKILIN